MAVQVNRQCDRHRRTHAFADQDPRKHMQVTIELIDIYMPWDPG